ncbi:hypothetical protein KJ766_00850 [Patescibacteria group bacterium]|nr:hypothetical protein [Patescibacteria group bacterium]
MWIAIGVIGIIFLFLFTIGKDYAVTLLLSVYMALVTLFFVPFFADFNIDIGIENYQLKLIAFLLFVIVFFWLQARNEYFEPYTVPSSWENGIFALVISGLVLRSAAVIVLEESVLQINPLLSTLFVDYPASNIWVILPILTIVLLRGRT